MIFFILFKNYPQNRRIGSGNANILEIWLQIFTTKLFETLNQLSSSGYDCLKMKEKSTISGREVLGYWAKQIAGVSDDFSSYLIEDSYNHMRLAQILLKNQIKQGLWTASEFVHSIDACVNDII